MKFYSVATVVLGFSSALAFQPSSILSRSTALNALTTKEKNDLINKVESKPSLFRKVKNVLGFRKKEEPSLVQTIFPGAVANEELKYNVIDMLSRYGFTAENTLVATSLCADELARRLEDEFNSVYGNNFNLGGLSGFPFAGNTGFGAMSAHIPDDGSCLIIYGPHVGVTRDGVVGKVERDGIDLVDNCCGSAIAASNYLKGITSGGAEISTNLQTFTDFQQQAVQELILPHGKRLQEAEDEGDRMVELPLALFDSQDILMREIVSAGAAGGKKNGYAMLGGIQINTAPEVPDYFLPLRFDLVNTEGKITKSLLKKLQKRTR